MKMQIKDIVIYGKGDRIRVLPFNLGKVNIITGDSKTGKTALIDITDYCLGSSDCPVSDGKIRENAEWFGLRLQFGESQAFVARQNPSFLGQQTTNQVYLEQGDKVEIPKKEDLILNSTVDALVSLLSSKIAISENLNVPPEGQTRDALEANFNHSKIFCFQRQNVIAQPSFLFHRQSEFYIAQAIKDTIPYFLGAVREDNLKVEQELLRKKRELKKKQRELDEILKINQEGASKAFSLLEEAKELQLIDADIKPSDVNEAVVYLHKVLEWEIPSDSIIQSNEILNRLQEELKTLQREHEEKSANIHAAELFANEIQGYTDESRQQEIRLESINLFRDSNHQADICPLCSQKLIVQVPTALEINKSIENLRKNLETTSKERPKLRAYINELSEEKEKIKNEIDIKKNAIKAIYQETESAKRLKDLNIRKGRVIGRISLFLESVDFPDDYSSLESEIESLKKDVSKLEEKVSLESKEERLSSILNIINVQMNRWSEQLDLEYKGLPIRFDLKKLTLIVDSEKGPIPLKKIGSGENWVAYHLLIHLALHKYFIKANRPVPSFLFLDQPTQVYYPPDKRVKADALNSSDDKAVKEMFNLIFNMVNSLNGEFQVIITDHAHLKMDDFTESIIEEWRDGEKLVPEEWYN